MSECLFHCCACVTIRISVSHVRMANVHKRMKVWHAHCFHGERGARAECDCTVCTQLQCIMSNNVVVVSKSDAGVDMKGLGFKL